VVFLTEDRHQEAEEERQQHQACDGHYCNDRKEEK